MTDEEDPAVAETVMEEAAEAEVVTGDVPHQENWELSMKQKTDG